MATSVSTTRRQDLLARARPLGVAATAGFAMSALVGGVGGRLAMLVLRLTSDASLHGLETDDGFTIGIVSAATMFLVMATAVLGVVGGLVYLVVRSWLPPARRPLVFGAFTGIVGGSLVIHPGGIDFTLLDPLLLAIVLFVALPAAFGVAVAALIERWLRETSSPAASRGWLAGLVIALLPLAFLGSRGLVLLLVVPVALAVRRWVPDAGRLVASPPVLWLGRAGLVGVCVVAATSLVSDVADIL